MLALIVSYDRIKTEQSKGMIVLENPKSREIHMINPIRIISLDGRDYVYHQLKEDRVQAIRQIIVTMLNALEDEDEKIAKKKSQKFLKNEE